MLVNFFALFTLNVISEFRKPFTYLYSISMSGAGHVIDMNNRMTQGLLMGILSSVCYAIRNLILKTQIRSFNGSVLMFYQMAVMLLVLFPVVFLYDFSFSEVQRDLPYIIFLGLITTAVGHTLFLNSFKHFSVSTASIMSSVQPIYGILLAMFFLGEFPERRSIIGGILILSTVILESIWSSKKST